MCKGAGIWIGETFDNTTCWMLQSQLKNFLKFVAGQGLHVGYVHPK